MGAGIAASLSHVVSSEAWARNDRGPKLRQLFGFYRSQDCWAVTRKFRQIDDGNGFVSFEELQEMLCLPEFHLLFIWDVFSQQNELIDSRELLTVVCIFSSARLEEKGRFLVSLFDKTQTGRCTGAELAQLCVMVLTVLAKCTGAVVKPKDVAPKLRQEYASLVPEYAVRVASEGSDNAWHKARIVGQNELDGMLPTIAAAYEALPLAGPPPPGALSPPPEGWASAKVRGGATPAKPEAQRNKAPGQAAKGRPVAPQSKETDLSHLKWLRKMDDELSGINRSGSKVKFDAQAAAGNQDSSSSTAPAHRWLVLRGKDFASIAKDIKGFRALFAKSVSRALGLPSDCIEVVNVSSGSIVVEFIMRPADRGNDQRSASELVLLLEQQLGNQHSALRKGPLGAYTDSAELLAGAPKPGHDRGGPRPRCDRAAQTDASELATPRPAVRKRSKSKAVLGRESPEEELTRRIQEAVRELDAVRQRTEKARAAEKAALEELQQRDAVIAELGGVLGGAARQPSMRYQMPGVA